MIADVDIRVLVLVDGTHFDLLQLPGVDPRQLDGGPPYLLPECSRPAVIRRLSVLQALDLLDRARDRLAAMITPPEQLG